MKIHTINSQSSLSKEQLSLLSLSHSSQSLYFHSKLLHKHHTLFYTIFSTASSFCYALVMSVSLIYPVLFYFLGNENFFLSIFSFFTRRIFSDIKFTSQQKNIRRNAALFTETYSALSLNKRYYCTTQYSTTICFRITYIQF